MYNPSKFKNGVYRIFWIDGGSSLASFGRLHDGTCWFAPSNWVAKCEHGIACTKWEMVDSMELIDA